MSDKEQGNAAMSTSSTDREVPGKSLSQVSTSNPTPRILSEHNYTFVPPKAASFKRNLRHLIVSLHDRTSPKESQRLPNRELSRLVHYGDVLQKRLRRLVASRRRYIDFEPINPLQEAIAQELAKKLGCPTRIYNGWNDSRYLVVYRPGVKPNAFELRARRMCHNDRDQEIYTVEEEEEQQDDCPLEPMSLSDNKLHWHQPMKQNCPRMEASSTQNSLSLGRQIFEKFKREFQAIR